MAKKNFAKWLDLDMKKSRDFRGQKGQNDYIKVLKRDKTITYR